MEIFKKYGNFLVFGAGSIVGFVFAFYVIYENCEQNCIPYKTLTKSIDETNFNSERNINENDPVSKVKYYFEFESKNLRKNVRVLCWVLTKPENHRLRAAQVLKTWGKRCNKLIFFSSKNDTEIGAIDVPGIEEGRDYLWAKTKWAFKYIYSRYLDEYDWFLKADDDTYVIIENLRYFLMNKNTSRPLYFGCNFKRFVKQGYMSGGAGYVLSRESLKRFVEQALPNSVICSESHSGDEDVEMGNLNESIWYWDYVYYSHELGPDCCSDTAISFHYIKPEMMAVLDYFIYKLKPYGILPEWTNYFQNFSKS